MSPALVTAICTGTAGILGALTALVKAFRVQSNLDAHVNDPGAHQ